MGRTRKCVIDLQTQKYELGQRIECLTFQEMKRLALRLSSLGYGVGILGFNDIEYHVLTITALPEEGAEI